MQNVAKDRGIDITTEEGFNEVENIVSLDFSDSGPIYQQALDQLSQQGGINSIARAAVPLRTNAVTEIEAQVNAENTVDPNRPDFDLQQQFGLATQNNKSPETKALAHEVNGYYDAGTPVGREIKREYGKAKSGALWQSFDSGLLGFRIEANASGGAMFTRGQSGWDKMDDDQKKDWARNYVTEKYGENAMDLMNKQFDAEAQYLQEHPFVAGYFGVRDLYQLSNDKETFIRQVMFDNEDFKRWVGANPDSLKEVDDEGIPKALGWEGYFALMGKSRGIFGEQPDANRPIPIIPGLAQGATPGDYYLEAQAEQEKEFQEGSAKEGIIKELGQVYLLQQKAMELDPSGILWQTYVNRLAGTTKTKLDDVVPGSYDILKEFKIGDGEFASYEPKGWTKDYVIAAAAAAASGTKIDFDAWYANTVSNYAKTKKRDEQVLEDFSPDMLFPTTASGSSPAAPSVTVSQRTEGYNLDTGKPNTSIAPGMQLSVIGETTVNGQRWVNVFISSAGINTWLPASSLMNTSQAAAD